MSLTNVTVDTDTSSDNDTMIIIYQIKGLIMIFNLLIVIGTDYKSIMVMTITKLKSTIKSYPRIRSLCIRVIKMHVVTISLLTEATPSSMKETASPLATLNRYPVNSNSLCVCVEFQGSNAPTRAIDQ